MDYKSTYTYFFKTSQKRLSYLLQSELSKYLEQGRPFTFVDDKILQFYENQLTHLKEKWNYTMVKPIINLIGLRNSHYSKHALNKILSYEVQEEFKKLELNVSYKYFIAQLAQLQAIEEGYINYKNNRPYYDLCYQTGDIEKINLNKIEDGYNNLDDFHNKAKELNLDTDVGITIEIPSDSGTIKKNGLKDTLTEDEKVLIIQILYELKIPLNKLLKAPEFYRLVFLTDGLFNNDIIDKKLSNHSVYRKLGKHVDISKRTERDRIESLIQKLQKLKVDSFIPELRKLLVKTT